MTDVYRIWIGMKFHSYSTSFPVYCVIPVRVFVPRRQSLPSSGMQEKTIVLSVSDLFHRCWRPYCHDWNCMSLLWNIVHVPSTENTLPLSFQRRLSFLFWLLVTDLLSTTSFRTLKFRVLIIWSTWFFTTVFNCWQFGSWSYKANTVWSWTEFSTFDLFHPSRIISESTSLTDNKVWSHLTSKSWTSSFRKLIVNKVESPCTASWAPVARKCS